jgi:UDP-2-acetamido-2-deoxy-ribo-hexuluronate aminotransferase
MDFIDLKTQYQRVRATVNARIQAVLDHGQYILGPEVAELEKRLAEYVGVRHCVSASSGTDTLLIALLALGVKPGDEIITSPFTFIATGEMILLAGCKPVFVDIDPRTYNIDPSKIEAAITERTKAIMPVSLYGQCADFDAINAIAARHGLPVIEDAAQSFGARYKGRLSCGLSTIGSTSFFPSKPLGAYGDGGALFTNDDALAKLFREIRVHGQDRRYHHPRLGLNGRLDTLQAAILLAKMDVFEDEVAARARIGARYTALIEAAFSGVEPARRVRTPFLAAQCTSVYAQYTIEVPERDQVEQRMKAAGIPTAVHYPVPLHLQPVFASVDPAAGQLPVAEAAAQRVMSLPMHPYLTEAQQEQIVAALKRAVLG